MFDSFWTSHLGKKGWKKRNSDEFDIRFSTALLCERQHDETGKEKMAQKSSLDQLIHLSGPGLFSLRARLCSLSFPPSSTGGNHSFACPTASSLNFPLFRMFISHTNTLRKSLFSRGSRSRGWPSLLFISSHRVWAARCLLLGVPSGSSHVGGLDALAVRMLDGMQVARGTTGGS